MQVIIHRVLKVAIDGLSHLLVPGCIVDAKAGSVGVVEDRSGFDQVRSGAQRERVACQILNDVVLVGYNGVQVSVDPSDCGGISRDLS